MTGARSVDEWLQRFRARVIYRELDEIRESVVKRVIMLPVGLESSEQRWRTMHALGHIDLHVGNQRWMLLRGLEWQVRKQEQQAERWTAERLIPIAELLELVEAGLSSDDMTEHFGVPQASITLAIDQLREPAVYTQPAVGAGDALLLQLFRESLALHRRAGTAHFRRR